MATTTNYAGWGVREPYNDSYDRFTDTRTGESWLVAKNQPNVPDFGGVTSAEYTEQATRNAIWHDAGGTYTVNGVTYASYEQAQAAQAEADAASGVSRDPETGQFVSSGAAAADTTTDLNTGDVVATLRYLFPSWPDELLTIYAEEWVETGDADLALARTRASDPYEQYFPGIRREDGSLRMNEGEYLSALDLFNAELESIGINSQLFRDTFTQLVGGDVSPREMLARVESAYTTVMDRAPEIMQAYAEQAGLTGLTPEALVASFLDPSVGEEILNRRIGMAEIAGQAAVRDFSLDLDLVERLYEVGISSANAVDAFSAAADAVPVLNVLARRHNDPDDDFDIGEFVGAQLLDDPFQRRRMRTLLSQERSLFTETGALARDRGGAVRGLVVR